ncbi:hypothetical protein DMC30DRAFT_446414 [Rhodotorula diobovata]|uniref:Protein yippee-like n=1 Tax=Rhodotorula diobovata TaxID=5288 RepID=A0A5C5FX34_9BASI|nr:hypothetical protein DMC30DRAFT_446414 [Rhodotorula diobovata]
MSTAPAAFQTPASITPHPTLLPSHCPSYRCSTCTLELALQDELVSRSFQGSSGPAYLWRTVINADVGPKESKQLLSGKHLIAPLTCRGCSTEVGWKYFVSPDSTQRYKEGKCILEKGKIYKARTATFSDNKWSVDDDDDDEGVP